MWELTSMISSCMVVMKKTKKNINIILIILINSINKSIRFQFKSHYLAITFGSHGSSSKRINNQNFTSFDVITHNILLLDTNKTPANILHTTTIIKRIKKNHTCEHNLFSLLIKWLD